MAQEQILPRPHFIPACILIIQPNLLHDFDTEIVICVPIEPSGATQGSSFNILPRADFSVAIGKNEWDGSINFGLNATAGKGIAARSRSNVE